MWLFHKQGFAAAKIIENLVFPWFGCFLGMASACVVYGFALIFWIFQLQVFFLDFCHWAFVWGPIMSPKHLSRGGGSLLAPKKHHIKEALVKESARFSSIFIENSDSLCFWYIFIGLGPCQRRKIKFSSDVAVWQARVCRCEIHSKSVVSLVWVLLGHGLCMCSVWFCIDFVDFSTSIFFSDFFLGAFVWGPIMSPKHLSRGGGNALLAPKNTL